MTTLLLLSCTPDCKQEKIKKSEWITRYEDADTLASYSIVQDYIHFDENISSPIQSLVNSHNNLYKRIYNLYYKSRNSINDENELRYICNNFSSKSFSGQNKITRIIKIQNNSDFSASFAIKDINKFFAQTEYRAVPPHGITEFRLSKSIIVGNNGSFDFTSDLIVIQKRQTIKQIRRIDEIITKDTIVNNCDCDIDALQAEYKAMRKVFEKLKNEKLIKTE